MVKIHEILQSKNGFYLGCCVSGPPKEFPGMIYIHVCIAAFVVPLCIFMLEINWEVSPALPLSFLLCVSLAEISLIFTACSNPGIIPKRPIL